MAEVDYYDEIIGPADLEEVRKLLLAARHHEVAISFEPQWHGGWKIGRIDNFFGGDELALANALETAAMEARQALTEHAQNDGDE